MSVFLQVEHVTTYRYNKPVEFSRHRVMFRPRAAHDIRVLSATLAVSPHSTQYWKQDVFSNSVAVVEPRVPANMLEFRARFIIEHFGVKNLELPVAPEAKSNPLVLKATINASEIIYWSNDREEDEVILRRSPPYKIDSNSAEWPRIAQRVERARRAKSRRELRRYSRRRAGFK